MSILNVAIVGAGNISRAHMDAWKNVEDAKVTAVCDIREEMVQRAKDFTGATGYSDFDEMLAKETIDILDICLPTNLHADFAVKAMNRGIHVITEKPLSLNKADVKRTYAAAQKNNVRFMTAQVLRFWQEYELLREAYRTKKYGALISATMTRVGSTPRRSWDNWMLDEKRSGLTPFDLHIHDLDFLVYAFGKPASMQVNRARGEKRDDIHVVYHYDGFFVSCQATWYNAVFRFRSAYRFQFEKAVMEYESGALTIYHEDGTNEQPVKATATFDDPSVPTSNAYLNEIRYFVDCVKAGRDCDKVKAHELETVLTLIEGLA
ncbi:MAG: Gfo/Idh/MocA family oxidoreductase [Clostridiales bacterium]|nr:Gfo/Idh/MocA family oxidoreductase [Clostridiales bacterium]